VYWSSSCERGSYDDNGRDGGSGSWKNFLPILYTLILYLFCLFTTPANAFLYAFQLILYLEIYTQLVVQHVILQINQWIYLHVHFIHLFDIVIGGNFPKPGTLR
jgi:hypothetical protein